MVGEEHSLGIVWIKTISTLVSGSVPMYNQW
jgi:hypothetical protein